jgi:hypothetical protein
MPPGTINDVAALGQQRADQEDGENDDGTETEYEAWKRITAEATERLAQAHEYMDTSVQRMKDMIEGTMKIGVAEQMMLRGIRTRLNYPIPFLDNSTSKQHASLSDNSLMTSLANRNRSKTDTTRPAI